MLEKIAKITAWLYDWLDSHAQRRSLEKAVIFLAAGGFVAHLTLIALARFVPSLGDGLLVNLNRNFLAGDR